MMSPQMPVQGRTALTPVAIAAIAANARCGSFAGARELCKAPTGLLER
jgi:hypothetical protein